MAGGCMQLEHPLATYNAAVMRASGEHMPVDCDYSAALFARLARQLQLPQMAMAKHALDKGHTQRALWHYLVASEGGSHLASLNALWLITHGCVLPVVMKVRGLPMLQ
jgi:hypothetical protein